jgi:hypothetical protein
MKQQARPFTVELKSKRRPLQGSHTNWSAVFDEPSPDDLPSRDVRVDASDTPSAAATRVFSAFATGATPSASTLGDLAAAVFTPEPPGVPAGPATVIEEKGRTGRTLPSLLPPSPLDGAPGREERSSRNAAPIKPSRKRALVLAQQQETPEPTHAALAPAGNERPGPELRGVVKGRGRSPKRRGAAARVRAGEGWKRRRLPKSCW